MALPSRSARYWPVSRAGASVRMRVFGWSLNAPSRHSIFCGSGIKRGRVPGKGACRHQREEDCSSLVSHLVALVGFVVRQRRAGGPAVVPPELVDHVNQHQAADDEYPEQHQRQAHAAIKEIANREQRRPDGRAARRPAKQRQGDVLVRGGGFLFRNARFLADAPSSRGRTGGPSGRTRSASGGRFGGRETPSAPSRPS